MLEVENQRSRLNPERERGVRAVGIERVGSEGLLEEIVHAVSVRIGLGGSGGWGTPTILAR